MLSKTSPCFVRTWTSQLVGNPQKTANQHETFISRECNIFFSNKNVNDHATQHCTDFYNIGGFEVLASLLQDKRLSIKVAAAELIATFVQNNPFCQQKVLEDPFLLTHLLSRVQDDGEEAELRIKCLYAVSCAPTICSSPPFTSHHQSFIFIYSFTIHSYISPLNLPHHSPPLSH